MANIGLHAREAAPGIVFEALTAVEGLKAK